MKTALTKKAAPTPKKSTAKKAAPKKTATKKKPSPKKKTATKKTATKKKPSPLPVSTDTTHAARRNAFKNSRALSSFFMLILKKVSNNFN